MCLNMFEVCLNYVFLFLRLCSALCRPTAFFVFFHLSNFLLLVAAFSHFCFSELIFARLCGRVLKSLQSRIISLSMLQNQFALVQHVAIFGTLGVLILVSRLVPRAKFEIFSMVHMFDLIFQMSIIFVFSRTALLQKNISSVRPCYVQLRKALQFLVELCQEL